QYRGGGGAVFGLTEEIGRANLAVNTVVGDDQGLGWSCKQIDTDASEKLALGFGDVGVPGTDDHIHWLDGLRPERHGCDRLHAPKDVDFVGAAKMHRRNNCRMRPTFKRWSTGDDALHACDLGSHDRHMR